MNKINYHDIDFNELTKLNVESSESSIYVDKNRKRLYKIFKTRYLDELFDKSEKLDLLVQKNHIKRMIVPDTKIINYGCFVGTVEEYINGVDLSDIFKKYDNINDIMGIFIKSSIALEEIHKEEIVVADVHAGNIRIDENGNPYYLDALSCCIGDKENNMISCLLYDYFKEKNIQIKKVTKEMDKLSFMLMIYTLLCQNMFDENKKLDFNSRFERLKYLKKILGIFELLNSIEENIDVPYLHEIIKPSHIKKYKKEMH